MRPQGRRSVIPVVPLVLGGDDLTVVCDGRQAMGFTKTFIAAFERETEADSTISAVMKKTPCQGKVTSCAGVAIVKPHFPFHASYALAEELLKSAKKCKPNSAIDFHMLYDASGADLERIRRGQTKDGGATLLIARPYVVTPGQGLPGRHWEDLAQRVEAVVSATRIGGADRPTACSTSYGKGCSAVARAGGGPAGIGPRPLPSESIVCSSTTTFSGKMRPMDSTGLLDEWTWPNFGRDDHDTELAAG